jgi:hypothetical protein
MVRNSPHEAQDSIKKKRTSITSSAPLPLPPTPPASTRTYFFLKKNTTLTSSNKKKEANQQRFKNRPASRASVAMITQLAIIPAVLGFGFSVQPSGTLLMYHGKSELILTSAHRTLQPHSQSWWPGSAP